MLSEVQHLYNKKISTQKDASRTPHLSAKLYNNQKQL